MKKRIIVVGSGGAGLCAALAAAEKGGEVWLLSKTAAHDGSCTAYSGGLFSLASGRVTPEDHYRRVMDTGQGVSDPELVRVLAEASETSLRTLAEWGVTLKINNSGHGSVRESAPSAIMGGGGMTRELADLARARGVVILENSAATRILSSAGRVEGLEWVNWRTGKSYRAAASAVVLATGGGGRIYPRTDNPARMTGDGYALALEAGLNLVDMEYVQFYPLGWDDPAFPTWMVGLTILDYIPVTNGEGKEFLMEALLSWGLKSGKEANLFSRDKAAVFLNDQEKRGTKAYLHLEKLTEEMLTIPDVKVSLMADLPPERRRTVAVSPIQHYFTGGIPIDTEGRTALPGLYACGEVTAGVDGASRMGGNALTNIVVFGLRAGQRAADEAEEGRFGDMLETPMAPAFHSAADGAAPKEVRGRLQTLVGEALGPCRNGRGLEKFLADLEEWEASWTNLKRDAPIDLLRALEMRGLLWTAKAVGRAALLREESRGVHFREDFPEERPEWKGRISVGLRGGSVRASREI